MTSISSPESEFLPDPNFPFVTHVAIIGERTEYYRLPPIEQLEVIGETKCQLRVKGLSKNIWQHKAYCLPNHEAWKELQNLYAQLQQAIDKFTDGLRQLGSYSTNLQAAGGVQKAQNPLTPIIVGAPDPDTARGLLTLSPWQIYPTALQQYAISSHTPKMLRIDGEYTSTTSQKDFFCCPDEASWKRIEQLYQNAGTASETLQSYLDELGTYEAARKDNRHSTAPPPGQQIKNSVGVNIIKDDNDLAPAIVNPGSQQAPIEESVTTQGGEKMNKQQLDISKIRTDGGTQPRTELNQETIEDYAHAMREGDQFPPVTAYYDGENYWLADGFHRVAAAKQAAKAKIEVDLKQGTRRDAVLHSVGANADHGLRRSNADKQRAIETLLRDPEWQQWNDSAIARACRVDPKTVGKMRENLGIPKIEHRKVERGGKAYTMHTGNIGAKQSENSESQPPESKTTQKHSEQVQEQAPLEAPAFQESGDLGSDQGFPGTIAENPEVNPESSSIAGQPEVLEVDVNTSLNLPGIAAESHELPNSSSIGTITIALQILPGAGPSRKVVCGVRSDEDPPLTRVLEWRELNPLPTVIQQLIEQLGAELPQHDQEYSEGKEAENNL